AEMMAAAVIDMDPARHAQPVDAKRRQKRMQDAGVIGVFGIFEIQLPVVRQNLGAAAEDARRPVQYPTNSADDLGPEITFEIRRIMSERAENEAGELGHPQWGEIVLVFAEFRRHAALPFDAALKGDPGQLAGQIISPAVVDALDLFDVTLLLETQQVAA